MARGKYNSLYGAPALLDYAESYNLRTTDRKVYRALQTLEIQQDGLNKDVVATHRTISRCAKVSLNSVKPVLTRLVEKGLISYTPGSRNYADHKASRVRRYLITELKDAQPASKLASILNKRPIQYGPEKVRPKYNVGSTNRLYASKPNVQGNKGQRMKLLSANCRDGDVLVELDIVAAEPTVIAEELDYPTNGYAIIAEAEGVPISEIKPIFNRIVYSRSSAIKAAYENGIKSEAAIDFFRKADEFRLKLRAENKRHVITRAGTRIDFPLGKKIHKGALLSYFAQGTIADVINTASLEIIAQEQIHGWRYIAPCHDAVYVSLNPETLTILKDLLMSFTLGYNLALKLKSFPEITQPKGVPKIWYNPFLHSTNFPVHGIQIGTMKKNDTCQISSIILVTKS